MPRKSFSSSHRFPRPNALAGHNLVPVPKLSVTRARLSEMWVLGTRISSHLTLDTKPPSPSVIVREARSSPIRQHIDPPRKHPGRPGQGAVARSRPRAWE